MNYLEISLPSSDHYERDRFDVLEKSSSGSIDKARAMHIGGFNFLQQNKAVSETSDTVGPASVLKEFNKNSTSDNFKVNKKYKIGHVNKSFETSSAYGEEFA